MAPVIDAAASGRNAARTVAILRSVDRPIVVACSGGADSALLAFLAAESGVSARLVHVDHGLGPHAAAGVESVRALAARCGLEVAVRRVDPAAILGDPRGVEAGARTARYAALRASLHADEVVATAHTGTDRLTTLLMRVAQGAGLPALEGPRADGVVLGVPVVRPMLHWWRDEVVGELAARDWVPHHDPANDDPRFLRNRVEREVAAPLLALADRRVLERSLRRIAADAALLSRMLEHTLSAMARTAPDGSVVVARAALAARPIDERQALVAALLRRLPVRPSEAMVERVAGLAEVGGGCSGRGLRAECGRDWMRVAAVADSRAPLPALFLPACAVGVGRVVTCLGDLDVEQVPVRDAQAALAVRGLGPVAAMVDLDAAHGPLVLRSVGADERLVPVGRTSATTVASLARTSGLGAADRRCLVAVCDDAGPLWLPGLRRGARALVGDGTRRVVRMQWTPVGAAAASLG